MVIKSNNLLDDVYVTIVEDEEQLTNIILNYGCDKFILESAVGVVKIMERQPMMLECMVIEAGYFDNALSVDDFEQMTTGTQREIETLMGKYMVRWLVDRLTSRIKCHPTYLKYNMSRNVLSKAGE